MNAYVQVTLRLNVRFASGQQVFHDDVGVAVLQATRGSDLEGTTPERYETVLKAAIMDAIKACAEYLGTCFGPPGDEVLDRFIRAHKRKSAQPGGKYSKTSSRQVGEREAIAPSSANEASVIGPTEFWSRFAEFERQGLISPDLRTAPQVKQARHDGDWSHLIAWLKDQANH